METQSDLEVILEFLEEYYKQNAEENAVHEKPAPLQQTSDQCWSYIESPDIKPALPTFIGHNTQEAFGQTTTASFSEFGTNFVSTRQSVQHPATAARGKRLRLFHFLYEMLEDPNMSHCLSWVPAAVGVFRFSSRNKDQVAKLWGQRKGNKRPMTYQKMSRALRNYAHSGQIFKVKKKLTYQFSTDTLMSLQKCYTADV